METKLNIQNNKTILLTGGAGYIGTHTARELAKAGYSIVIIDNLATGKRSNLAENSVFIEGDFADIALLNKIFTEHKIDAVMHFAASIEVGESVEKPLEYLENNTFKTARLIKTMLENNVKKLIFSSTAAVYGLQKHMPISESATTAPIDPYGSSKLLTEQLIDYYCRFAGLEAIIFRYFNACGSDFDKTIYSTHESHLIPRVIDVAEGRREHVEIYGTDYDTIDGSGVRDYVHVLDVARAHVAALEKNQSAKYRVGEETNAYEIYNIGTSTGLSVKNIIDAVQDITGKQVPVRIKARRPGDSPITVADNTKIRTHLNFELKHSDIETIIKTSWH